MCIKVCCFFVSGIPFFLARVAGNDPKDIVEAARVDMVNEHQEDIRNAYVKLIYQNYVRTCGHQSQRIRLQSYWLYVHYWT